MRDFTLRGHRAPALFLYFSMAWEIAQKWMGLAPME